MKKKLISINQPFPFLHFVLGVAMICLLSSFIPSNDQYHANGNEVKWAILPNSFITINGSSNVNTFGCEANGTFKAETLRGAVAKDGKTIEMKGSVTIAINQFDCNNRLLTNDLRKTLKADEHPQMVIRFLALERMPFCDGGEDFVSGKVIIELAGQRKPFELRYSFIKTASGYKLQGSRAFSFADFDLTPPKKIGGLVKVKDDFDVAFTLLLNNIN